MLLRFCSGRLVFRRAFFLAWGCARLVRPLTKIAANETLKKG